MLTMSSPPVNSLGTSLVTSFKRLVWFLVKWGRQLIRSPMRHSLCRSGDEAVGCLGALLASSCIAAQAGVPETGPGSKGSAGVCGG